MANHPSAAKRYRQTTRRTDVNIARRSRLRTFIKEAESAVASGDKGAAEKALRAAQPEMQKSVQKGIVHWRTMSRKISRLSARIKAL
jgi:small subunit ribosomal protein S20